MARGQQKYWQLLQKVPKEPTKRPVRIDRCIWWGNGVFQLYRYTDGKSKYVDSFPTIDLAMRARDGAADDRSTAAPESRQLLNEYFDGFFLPVTESAKKPSTMRAMKARYNTYVRDSLGARRLRDVTAADIAWFQAKVERREVSGQTKRETLSLVRAIFAHAVDTKSCRRAPR
jgi:hypothetical protein